MVLVGQYLVNHVAPSVLSNFGAALLRNVGLLGSGKQSAAFDAQIQGVQKYLEGRTLAEFSAGWRSLRDARDATDEANRKAALHSVRDRLGPVVEQFSEHGKTAGRSNSQLRALTCLCIAAAAKALNEEKWFAGYVAEAMYADRNIAATFLADGDRAKIDQILNAVGDFRETAREPAVIEAKPADDTETKRIEAHIRLLQEKERIRLARERETNEFWESIPVWLRPFAALFGLGWSVFCLWALYNFIIRPFLPGQH